MKSLKITFIAIFSIALLTGVSQSNSDTDLITEKNEVKKAELNLLVLHKKKGSAVPPSS